MDLSWTLAVLACFAAPGEDLPIPLAPIPPEGRAAVLREGKLHGRLLDNTANRERQGSGFNPLFHADFPGKPIFITGATGLNFEHIFNGVAGDNDRAMFTPREDPVELQSLSESSARLIWPAADSSWGMACQMTYTLVAPDAIDMEFEATPTKEVFGKGYAALMWASYIACARDRRLHFIGPNGWQTWGEESPEGPEMGTVAHADASPLNYDPSAQTLNIVEHPEKKFVEPFYYGLLDGDHDLTTMDDTIAYVMMFDEAASIRFAMWNFIKDDNGSPNTHHPAWDWQFVIHDPRPTKTCGYRARLLIRPFEGREAVARWYEDWRQASQK